MLILLPWQQSNRSWSRLKFDLLTDMANRGGDPGAARMMAPGKNHGRQ